METKKIRIGRGRSNKKVDPMAMLALQGPLSLQIRISQCPQFLMDRHHLQLVCLDPSMIIRGANHLLATKVHSHGRISLNVLSVVDAFEMSALEEVRPSLLSVWFGGPL